MIKNQLHETNLTTKDFFYNLPEPLIAQTPATPRDASRLMVLKRNGGTQHLIFREIINLMNPEDVLVINDSRVLPARIYGHRMNEKFQKNGEIELLLLKQKGADTWEVLVRPGKRAKISNILDLGDGKLRCEVESIVEEGNRIVKFSYNHDVYTNIYEVLHEIGMMPLPPYITQRLDDPERYQTVYSRETGSAAAPTAGLHFTLELLDKIREKGIAIAPVMLHVGLGTFRPVKADKITDHVMHTEYFSVSAESAAIINQRKKNGGRVIAVGTTSCRVLESACGDDGFIEAASGDTGIFIYPGYKFKIVDSLITNFHLPESTLLMLVSAIAGKDRIMEAYESAVKEKYRFFSFGDAMFIE